MSDKIYVNVGVDGRSIPAGGEAGQILQKASDADFDLQWTTPAGGASANIPQPAATTPVKDTSTGTVGTGVSFARSDHAHPLNKPSATPQMDGTAAVGTSDYYAIADHKHPSNTYSAGFVLDYNNNVFSGNNRPANPVKGQICFVLVS